jgi:hypothetical protein
MAQPTVYNWTAPPQPSIAALQPIVAFSPLILSGNIPAGINRNIIIDLDVNATTDLNFIVNYRNAFSQVKQSTVTIVSNTKTITSTIPYFSEIISIIPQQAPSPSTTKVMVGLSAPLAANDTTQPYLCDVWNKAALYSLSVRVTTAGTVGSIQPQYTLDPLPKWTSQNQVGAQADYSTPSWINMGDSIPLTVGNTGKQLSNIPATAIRLAVVDSGIALVFRATIMQQGGFF